MKKQACPMCGETNLKVERKPNGFTTCTNCGYHAKHEEFRHKPKMNNEQKEVFKQDRITQAVDAFNETLKDLGVCVGKVNYIKGINTQTVQKTELYQGKLVESRTYDLLRYWEK